MAFNFQDYTQAFSSGETEEQRRRREEQERIQREQQQAMQAQQAADEQARQQEEMKAQQAAQPQPGETVTEIPPGMANPNPYGSAIAQGGTVESVDPTQGGPVAPDQANIEEQRRLQQAQAAQAQQAAPMAQPVAPEQPQPVEQPQAMAQPAAPQMPQLPQPGPGVQVAGPAQMPPQETGQGMRMPAPAAAPAAAPQMSMQERIAAAAQRAQERAGTAAPGQMPAASVGSLQQVAQQQAAPSFESRFTDASTDVNKLMDLRKDPSLSAEQRTLAGRQAQDLLNRELGPIKGKEELSNMSELQIGQLLKSKSEEGSWAKLLLLGFVSPALAGKEAAKLGLNDQWTTGIDGQGNPVLLKTRDGVPVEGVNGTTGKALSPKELIGAASQTAVLKGANTSAQTYRDPGTGQTLTKVDTPQGPIYYDKARQRVVPKGEPVPLTAGSDISTQLQLSQMKRQQAFVGQTATERMRSFREVNNERTLAGQPPLTPEQMGLNANGELIGQAQPGMPATPPPPGAPGAPAPAADRAAGDVAALQREIAATRPNETGRLQILNQELAKAQQQMAAAGAVAPTQPAPVAAPVAPTAVAPAAGQTPAQMQAARQASAAGMKTEATETAQNLVANREALPKYESQAEQVLTTLNDALSHPGFSDVIGVPNIITGIWSPPSTDARNFKSKYDQLMGQQFLAAFQSLKGGGSITEVEGAKAEQAIAALKDPGISEVEFKRNAKILEDTVKSGVNRAREQVGLKPKYEVGKTEPANKANTPAKGTESTVGGVTYVYDGKGWKKK